MSYHLGTNKCARRNQASSLAVVIGVYGNGKGMFMALKVQVTAIALRFQLFCADCYPLCSPSSALPR